MLPAITLPDQKASAHALLDRCGWAPTVPSPTLFNPGASAEVTPGCGELPALVSMLLANCFDGEALHVYQPSLPPRIAIRGLDCSALLTRTRISPGRYRERPS
jgi:hypothetical protein